jgi:hypothetical protein
MKSEFRETSPQDAPAVRAFLQRIFEIDSDAPMISGLLHWKCWEPRSDWPGSRSYVLANGSELISHAAVMPLSCVNGQRRLSMVHLMDWAAEPKVVGCGVVLLKRISRMVDSVVSAGGSEMTQQLLPALGFKTLGEVTKFVRPLRPLRPMAGQRLTLRAGAQCARRLLWTLQAPSLRTSEWTVTRIAPEQLIPAALPWPRAKEGLTQCERSAQTLDYFLNCPPVGMELYLAAKSASVRGYFLLAYASGQARIADFHVDSEDPADWRALIQLAVSQARRNPDAAEIVSLGSDPVTRQALVDSGFHPRGGSTIRVWTAKGIEFPAGPFRFQMIDNDAASYHENKNFYWA